MWYSDRHRSIFATESQKKTLYAINLCNMFKWNNSLSLLRKYNQISYWFILDALRISFNHSCVDIRNGMQWNDWRHSKTSIISDSVCALMERILMLPFFSFINPLFLTRQMKANITSRISFKSLRCHSVRLHCRCISEKCVVNFSLVTSTIYSMFANVLNITNKGKWILLGEYIAQVSATYHKHTYIVHTHTMWPPEHSQCPCTP